MRRPARFKGKISWRKVEPAPGVQAWETKLWTEQFPEKDFSNTLLCLDDVARYLGMSRIIVNRLLLPERGAATKISNSYYFPLPFIDGLVRRHLPEGPIIRAVEVPDACNMPKKIYWKMWRDKQLPTFLFGQRSYITWPNLYRALCNLPQAEETRLTNFA